MENLIVVNPESDNFGTQKENIFIAQDESGGSLGSLRIYPYFDDDIEPDHPHNLFLHFQTEQGIDLDDAVKDLLLEHALRRAEEIKRETEQAKTRVYACYFKHQQEEINYYLQRGFTHDEGMLILERHDSTAPPLVETPEGITIQPWRMDQDQDQQQFIKTHRLVFPRHAYNIRRLQELKAMPDWENYTAFDGDEIIGNIMVFNKNGTDETGWIEDLFVLKEWRRRGIARCLLSRVLAYFHGLGKHRVQLEFWSANKPALRLYRDFGFVSIDETEIAVGRYV